MILSLSCSGQTGNQLMSLVSAYTLGLRYHDDVVCPVVSPELRKLIAFTAIDHGISVRMYHSRFWSVFAWVLKQIAFRLGLEFKRRYDPARRGRLQVFLHWCWHKEDEAIAENIEKVRRYFAFRPELLTRCREKEARWRQGGKILVAVHMRRGDYRSFAGGRFYFSDEECLMWMRALASEKDVRFVAFSNEKVDLSKYPGLDVVRSGGSGDEDLCGMSLCDYIIGPDSTYSWWAMVIGGVKRLVVEKGSGQNISFCEFKTLGGLL